MIEVLYFILKFCEADDARMRCQLDLARCINETAKKGDGKDFYEKKLMVCLGLYGPKEK